MREPLLYTDESPDQPIKLPTRWEICSCCSGNGTTSRHIEPEGGGFTASEWAEACDDCEDFAEDYFAGRYDRACDECDGTGKVKVVDEERCKPELLAEYRAQVDADRQIEAEMAAERRMGA